MKRITKIVLILLLLVIIFTRGIEKFYFDTISLMLFCLVILILSDLKSIATWIFNCISRCKITKHGVFLEMRNSTNRNLKEKEKDVKEKLESKNERIFNLFASSKEISEKQNEFEQILRERDSLRRELENIQKISEKYNVLKEYNLSLEQFNKNTEDIADYIHRHYYDDIDDYFITATKDMHNFCIDNELPAHILALMKKNGFIDKNGHMTDLAGEEISNYFFNLIFND